jgi:choline monooxygenase
MNVKSFTFQPDIAHATTIPARWYTDPAMLELEQDRIFCRTWQLVGRLEQVRNPGDFFTCSVNNEPLVVTRDSAGRLHAFYNVCRHRAGAVAQGYGNRKTLQCLYHAWTYGLDGKLITTPEFEGVEGFEKANYGLVPIRVDSWGPFVFVNLSPEGPSLHEMLGAIPQETSNLPLERMGFYKRVDYEINCNWKVYVDNYLEGYHIPTAHPGLFKEIDYKQYRVDTYRYYSKQFAPIREKPDSLYRRNLEEGTSAQALYYWVFPNLMLNIYPDNLQINIILPLGPDRTVTIFEWYLLNADQPGVAEDFARSFEFSDLVQKEDIEICELVQQRLKSRVYDTGRFSVLRENGVHHYHGLLAEFLQGA